MFQKIQKGNKMEYDVQKDIAKLKIHNKHIESKIDKIMTKLGIEQVLETPHPPSVPHYNPPKPIQDRKHSF